MPPMKWTITDADGTVIAEGEMTPIQSGGGAAQGQPTEATDQTEQETDDGKRDHE